MDEKRRICLLNDSFPPVIDGVANAVVNYAQNIEKNYGKAVVVTPKYPEADDAAFDFPIVRYPSIDLTKQTGYRAGMPFSPQLMRTLGEHGPDLIHSHCPIASTVVARLLRDQECAPLVLTYHTKFAEDIARTIRSEPIRTAAARMIVENISACDEVWTVSKGAGEDLRAFGYEGEYTVMPNGVDLPVGRVPDEAVRRVCAGYDLPPELPTYLFVGRMVWYKGMRITIDALKLLADEGKDFRMLFVGGGCHLQEVKDYCAELGLADKVFFVPPVQDRDELRAWYCRADLFLFPSTYDTNGLVVREAAACSLPSVLIAGSCASDGATDGRNCFLIEANAESMADCLRRIHGKRELLRSLGEAACRELYLSWEDAVRLACERYEIILEKHRMGEYPKQKTPSAELIRIAAESIAAINKLHVGLRDMQSELRAENKQFQERVSELLKHWIS